MTAVQSIFETVAELERRGTPAVIVTVVRTTGSAPRKAGAKMLVLENGETMGTVGGAMVEKLAIDTAMEVMRTGMARIESYDLNDVARRQTRMICGGSVELFFEPVATRPWLYLFGAGHCGRAIADIAHRAGFHCVVADDRPDLARVELFPYADEVLCAPLTDIAYRLPYRAPAYVVVATYCFDTDVAVARAVLQQGMPRYLGVIGSRKKRVELRRALGDIVDDALFEQIHVPIGLEIGAETPEEIAVSVVAELIREHHASNHPVECSPQSMRGEGSK